MRADRGVLSPGRVKLFLSFLALVSFPRRTVIMFLKVVFNLASNLIEGHQKEMVKYDLTSSPSVGVMLNSSSTNRWTPCTFFILLAVYRSSPLKTWLLFPAILL